jgi:glycosyltransferase involved in cell wall biosynthesis
VVTLTNAVADRLVQLNVVPRKKISVLFHPDLTFPDEERRDSETLRVLFFGRILPYKGISQFVGAMEILKGAGIPIHVGVFGAGDIGPEIERLRRLGAEVVNRWIDTAEIAEILGRHDVVVVSHTEASQSGVIAAAHGAGLPVVATPVGGLSEQIIPDVTGILASDSTAEAIASAVMRFTQDRTLLLRIRQAIVATRRERSVDRFFCALRDVALNEE